MPPGSPIVPLELESSNRVAWPSRITGVGAASAILCFPAVIDDIVLRWIVTVLFAASTAGYAYIMSAQRVRSIDSVNHLLHLAMSMAMLVMAWPAGMTRSAVGPMAFFLLAAVWFVFASGRVPSGMPGRLTNGYHAAKMTAMAWMYAVMAGSRRHGRSPRGPRHGRVTGHADGRNGYVESANVRHRI